MKTFVCLLSVLLAASTSSAASEQARAYSEIEEGAELIESIHVGGVIEVDTQGQVEQVTLRRSRLIPDAETRIVNAMQAWRFEPFLMDGQAKPIRTSVHLRIDQLKSPRGFQLAFGKVEFGQPLAHALTPPSYPRGSLRDGISAEVLLRLTLDDTGRVIEAEPVMARVLGQEVRSEQRHRRLVAPFVQSSLKAVQAWTYEFVESRANGDHHQLLTPVVYTVQGGGAADAGGDPTMTAPVLFELSSPLGRPLESLAREVEGRSEGLSLDPAPSPLKLRGTPDQALAM
jgi:hypothetical protein